MKFKKVLLLTLPMLLVSCGENTSSSVSTDSTPVLTTTDTENTTNSQTSTIKDAKDTFKEALHFMASQNKIAYDFNSESAHIDVKGTATEVITSTKNTDSEDGTQVTSNDETGETEGELEGGETEETPEPVTTTTPINIDATLTSLTNRLSFEGLKEETDTSKINGYMLLQSNVSFKYGFTKADTYDETITAKNAYLRAYLESNDFYLDLSDKNLISLIGKLPQIGQTISTVLNVTPYFKVEDMFSYDDKLPILNMTNEEIDNQLSDEVLNLISSNSTYDKSDNSYHFNMNITNSMLDLLPAAYKVYAESKLDKTDENYEEELKDIKETAEKIKEVTDKTTINTFKVSFAYGESGIQNANTEINMKLEDYTVAYDSTNEENSTATSTTVKFDCINLDTKSTLAFSYGDDVTVSKKPTGKTFIPLTL